MSRLSRATRSMVKRYLLPSAVYQGTLGTAWFAGFARSTTSIAAFYCGDNVEVVRRGRVRRHRIPGRVLDTGASGSLAVLRLPEPDPDLAEVMSHSISVPELVDIHLQVPTDVDVLREQLVTSTTREDFRRIRRAGFRYRVTTDPDTIREFHARHFAPLVARRFPDDGRVSSIGEMLSSVEDGGELVCADIGDDWVAGIFNVSGDENYALMTLGIRDADDAVRQKRVAAALIVRSLERAVELGRGRATLGRSLPFLGKGPVWFKAKWGGIVTRSPAAQDLHMFLDLRHAAVRRMLSASPVIHSVGDELVASAWLEPGPKALQAVVRDAGFFPGIARWYVFAEPETLQAGSDILSRCEQIVPVGVTARSDTPLWLGEMLPTRS